MGELTDALHNTFQSFEDYDDNDLDHFFTLLKYLNKSEPIDKKIVKRVTEFMALRN